MWPRAYPQQPQLGGAVNGHSVVPKRERLALEHKTHKTDDDERPPENLLSGQGGRSRFDWCYLLHVASLALGNGESIVWTCESLSVIAEVKIGLERGAESESNRVE